MDQSSASTSAHGEEFARRLGRDRQRVEDRRSATRERFERGVDGLDLATTLAAQMDGFLVELFENVSEALDAEGGLEQQGAILAVGGSGRGEMAPFSDVDLLFLDAGKGGFEVFAGQVVRNCWDVGLQLGHGVHEPRGAISLAFDEAEFATSLIGARCLWGHRGLAEDFRQLFLRQVVQGRGTRFYRDCVAAREAEWARHGGAASELVPDVKKSPGGLRDIHLVGWLGAIRFGSSDLEELVKRGALREDECQVLQRGREFLTRVRFGLHFHAGRSQDVLTRDEQLRLAETRGVEGAPGQRPVERFMQEYFQHTTAVARVTRRFVVRHRLSSVWERLTRWCALPRRRGPYRIGRHVIDVLPEQRGQVCGELESILELFSVAAESRVPPSVELLDEISQVAAGLPDQVSPGAARLFLELLARTGSAGETLRLLFEVGVLERLVPAMAHARCLMQFNQYHSYTVDEHSLRAVEAAEAFADEKGPVGNACREIARPDLLHLALLLHDLGKGHEEQHCEVGRRIAEETTRRLGLEQEAVDQLVFLVHRHLEMEQLATRRDFSDPGLLNRFAREVGSSETLRMLYVLTAADISAVGPGKWTSWKADLLTQLYHKTLALLTTDAVGVASSTERETADSEGPGGSTDVAAREEQESGLSQEEATDVSLRQASEELAANEVEVDGTYETSNDTLELRVLVGSEHAEGCFHRIAGTLTALRLEVLGAEISTSATGGAIDRFRVVDPDYNAGLVEERMREISTTIREAVLRQVTVRQLFARHRRFENLSRTDVLSDFPTRIVLDVSSSPRCTIVEVFAHDRPGLLYTIARTLFQLDLSVEVARIATHVDQIVDVLYLVDGEGQKIEDEVRRSEIRERLELAIERLEREGFVEPAEG